jgi:hypothetical protein
MARSGPKPKPLSPAMVAAIADRAVVASGTRTPAGTASRQDAFLVAISTGLTISEACAAVGISRGIQLVWRNSSPEFALRFADAEEAHKDGIIAEVRHRAFDRVERSDNALFFYAKRFVTSFRDNHRQQPDVVGEVIDLHGMLDSLREKAMAALAANRAAHEAALQGVDARLHMQIDGTMVDVTPVGVQPTAHERRDSSPPAPPAGPPPRPQVLTLDYLASEQD